jgi:hypothetical protein
MGGAAGTSFLSRAVYTTLPTVEASGVQLAVCDASDSHRSRKSPTKVVRLISLAAVLLVGTTAKWASAADPANYLFAISSQRSEVVVIDSSTDELVDRIPLPSAPSDIVVLNRGRYLAVADKPRGRLYIIDVIAGRLERSADVPLRPDVLRADRTGTTLAMLDRDDGKVAVGTANSGEFRLVSGLTGVTYMVFDAKGRVLAAHPAGATIVDATGKSVGELPVDAANGPATDVATDPGGEYAFVEQPTSGVLSVFDLRHANRRTTLRLPAPLGCIAPSLDSQFVLLPIGGKSLASISMWTLREKARFHLDITPDRVALALLQSIAVVTDRSDRELLLYDLWREQRSAEVRLPGQPGEGTASNDGGHYYVALPATGQIASVNISTGQIARLIDNVGIGVQTILSAAGENYCH